MAFVTQRHGCDRLSIYDMVKLHVMIDLNHVAKHGRPVIGGGLNAWQFGPVIPDAFKRLRHWAYKFEESGFQPETFDIVDQRGDTFFFRPTLQIEADDFSPSEVDAMNDAWTIVMDQYKRWNQSQQYFHEAISPIGEAWKEAWDKRTSIDWRRLLDLWGKHHHVDLSDLKQIVTH